MRSTVHIIHGYVAKVLDQKNTHVLEGISLRIVINRSVYGTMAKPLSNKVIAVTGAASGIAFATSKILFERGAILSLADLEKDRLDANLAAITGGSSDADSRILATAVDVRSSDSVDEWIKKTIDKFGRLDGAANIAGVVGANAG